MLLFTNKPTIFRRKTREHKDRSITPPPPEVTESDRVHSEEMMNIENENPDIPDADTEAIAKQDFLSDVESSLVVEPNAKKLFKKMELSGKG